jgi:acetolactate synthase-1/2/3 large subunit
MEAIGWAQVTGRVGVAMVTTGGGAANAVTGVLSANLDSVPVLIVAGNESSYQIESMAGLRAFGVQGFDAAKVMQPICKLSLRVADAAGVGKMVAGALDVCFQGRPGAVFLEFPMNLQRLEVARAAGEDSAKSVNDHQTEAPVFWAAESAGLEGLAGSLLGAQRPILYFGQGVRRAGAQKEAIDFAEKFEIPFVLSWSAIDLCGEDHPLNIGRAGIYGDRGVNIAIQSADFLLAIGTRLAIPQVGYDRSDFARKAERWVVDIDPTELSKFERASWNLVQSDARKLIQTMLTWEKSPHQHEKAKTWRAHLAELQDAFPRSGQVGPPVSDGFIHSFDFVDTLSDVLDASAIVVTDVGAGLLTGHYGMRIKDGQRMFTSQGLGEMGFGLPGAIGAKIAAPNRVVVCLNTDGGIMFNLQELQVLKTHKLDIKLVIFNNDGYAMIRSSQDNLFEGRRSGSDAGAQLGFPDFKELAGAFSLRHTVIASTDKLEGTLRSLLESDGPELIEVRMAPNQIYLPRLGTKRNDDGTLQSPPIEDMSPTIPKEQLAFWLNRHETPSLKESSRSVNG